MSFNTDVEVDPPRTSWCRLNSMCGPADRHPGLPSRRRPASTPGSPQSARTYEYGIFTRTTPDPFARHTTWHFPHPIDRELMGKAAASLLGEHALDSFGRVEEGKSPVRRVESIDIEHDGDLTTIRITANSFIQQMVRSDGRDSGAGGDRQDSPR